MKNRYSEAKVPVMSVDEAKASHAPRGFVFDGCSCFPDKLPSWKGWVHLRDICMIHDWHYAILRKHLSLWGFLERLEFRKWADACFQMRLVYRLRESYPGVVADTIARSMWAAVRAFGDQR